MKLLAVMKAAELLAVVKTTQLPVLKVEETEHPDVSEKTCNFSPSPRPNTSERSSSVITIEAIGKYELISCTPFNQLQMLHNTHDTSIIF